MNFHNNHDFITLFESRLSEYTGAPYVVLTDSCSNAIFLSLKYLNSPTVLSIPIHTYISIPQAINNAGYKYTGNKEEWVGSYNLKGTHIWDSAVGFHRDMYKKGLWMCLSFHQKKAIPIGKGGAILLDNKEDYDILKRMSWDGRDASIPVKDDLGIINGYHMNMTPEQAAKGVLLLNNYNEEFKQGSWKDYPIWSNE